MSFLQASAHCQFVHIAGGLGLTSLAIATGLVDEVDMTVYPVAGRAPLPAGHITAEYRRLHLVDHEDGRITTVWRRIIL